MHFTSLLTRCSTVKSKIGFTLKHLIILFNRYYTVAKCILDFALLKDTCCVRSRQKLDNCLRIRISLAEISVKQASEDGSLCLYRALATNY
jgi:hypothetical protein